MARTPLLKVIEQLFSEHSEADARGLPVHAVREGRAEAHGRQTNLSRRAILAGATAAGVGVMLPRTARAAGTRVAIVGAGISGLSAAMTLADNGVASTVYESSGRIGGRMFSNSTGYWSDSQVSEWCGELIDTGHVTIQALATRFNLALDDQLGAEPSGSTETYYFAGKYYSKTQADADFGPVYTALQADRKAAGYPTLYNSSTAAGRVLDAMTIYDWIESRVAGGHASPMGQLLDVAYNIEYGADTRDQSSLNLVYLLGYQPNSARFAVFGKSDEHYRIRGGNQQLPLAIAASLANPVQTGMRLTAVATNADGTSTLTFRSGMSTSTVVADHVILTLPFAVLRSLDYSKANFDALKVRAITELGRGHNGKLQLQFTSRLWNTHGPWGVSTGTSYVGTGYQVSWESTRGQPGQSAILNDYTGGSVTDSMSLRTAFAPVSNAQVRSDAQRFLTQVEPVFPGLTALWNGKATSSLPHLDPNFGCSYSYWRAGQYQAFSGYEKVRQGNVYFAGEHCSTDFQGFMEGGAAEGIRAAKEVLTSMGKKAANLIVPARSLMG